MNLLIYRYGSICEPDIIQTFQRIGFHVDEETIQMEQKNLSETQYLNIVAEKILENQYSFVFTVNFFPWLSQLCKITNLIYISLIVDSPVLELYDDAISNPCNRIFLFDKMQYKELHKLNPDCIFHMPLAANVYRTDKLLANINSRVKENIQPDISFIGSTYEEKCPFNKISLPPYEKGYADALIEAQLKIYGYNFIDEVISDDYVKTFIKSAADFDIPPKEMPKYKAIVAQHFLSVKAAEQERLRLLRLLSDNFNVDIYTGSDTSSMPYIHNRGYADSLVDMPVIFHQSKINLNITAKSIRTALPLRIFDVLGCGGFLITNFQAEIPDYFNIGEDLVTYDSPADLLDKCSYYLTHEQERRTIASNGYKKVKKFHTWDTRLMQILNLAFPE